MLGETGTHKATYAIQVACQAWRKSHERCNVRLAQAASSHHPARCKVHKKQSTTKASTPTITIVFYSCNRSTYRHGCDTTVGVRSMENKKFLPHEHKQSKIYLLDCSNELIRVLTLKDSKAVNESRFSWVMYSYTYRSQDRVDDPSGAAFQQRFRSRSHVWYSMNTFLSLVP